MAEVVDAPEEVLMLQEDETRMRERKASASCQTVK